MSSKAHVPQDSETARRAAEAVTQHPGATSDRLARVLSLSVPHTRKALTAAQAAGLVGLVRAGDCRTWWPAGDVAAVAQRLRNAQRQRDLAMQRDRNARQREEKAGRRAADAGDRELSDWPVRRSGVDPRLPLPFVCRAPRSVFELGGRL